MTIPANQAVEATGLFGALFEILPIRIIRMIRGLKILVIMLYWYPYEGPLMPIYGAIFKGLMDRGHRLTIVTSFPHYRKGRAETWDEYRGKWMEVTRWEERARLVRSYVYAPVFDQTKPGLLYRALNFISFNISCVISAILAGGKADVVFAPSSPPLTNGICAWIVGRFKRCPVIYNVQDLYPDMAEQLGVVKPGLFLQMLKEIEKGVYRLCDRILLLSEGMRKNVVGKGVAFKKTEVIPNFIDPESILPLPKENRFSRRWGLSDRFVAMYAGNVGLPHGTEVIVEAADMLKDHPDILFCLVGRGEYRDRVEKSVEMKRLKNVVFIPPQPEKEVPYIWASADISLVTYRKGLAGFSTPSKLLAAMAAARPVSGAVDEGSDAFRIIKDAKCGVTVTPEDAQSIAKAILCLRSRPACCSEMGMAGRKYAESRFSKEKVINAYEQLFLDTVVQA